MTLWFKGPLQGYKSIMACPECRSRGLPSDDQPNDDCDVSNKPQELVLCGHILGVLHAWQSTTQQANLHPCFLCIQALQWVYVKEEL